MEKSLTEIKNQVAQRHEFSCWHSLIHHPNVSRGEIDDFTTEAILEWGNQCKEAQRESDAQFPAYMVHKEYVDHLRKRILTNPLVTDKID